MRSDDATGTLYIFHFLFSDSHSFTLTSPQLFVHLILTDIIRRIKKEQRSIEPGLELSVDTPSASCIVKERDRKGVDAEEDDDDDDGDSCSVSGGTS